MRSHGVTLVAEDGAVLKLAGTVMDDTERVEADRVRRTTEARFELGFEQSGIGTGTMDLDGAPIRVNARVCAILGRPKEELVGRDWERFCHPDDSALGPAVMARVAAGHDTYAGERRYLRPDGTTVWTSLDLTLVRTERGKAQYFLAQLQDITERKQVEEEFAHQALHDTLTGLSNRTLLSDRLNHGLAGTRRRGTRLGVILIDVDHFKEVNDSLGHTFGDELLRHAAQRIAGVIRVGDTVARFGGDEFVIVCDDVSVLEMENIAERVLAVMREPFLIGPQESNVTCSLGLVVADADSSPESLLRDSDLACTGPKSGAAAVWRCLTRPCGSRSSGG